VEEARSLFKSILEMDRNYHESWMGLAIAEGGKNKEEIAHGIHACRNNIRTNPTKISHYFHLATLYLLTAAFSEEECVSHYNGALSETKEAYGFIYEAKFVLDIILERVDQTLIHRRTVQDITRLLDSYIIRTKQTQLPPS
jgi:hypothetical protein